MLKFFIAAPAVALLALVGCSDEKPERGLEALPDMFHTPAFESQNALVSADGKVHSPAMLTPPEGTVSRNLIPYSVDATDWASAKKLVNPQTPSKAVLKQGQLWFNQTCAACHGKDGNAVHGNVAKQFSGILSINGANVLNMSEGEIYHIITLGRNRMPNFSAQLPPAERWAVVSYLRLLARATIAKNDAAAVVGDAEGVIREKPADPAAIAAMQQGKTILEQRSADLAAILQLGDEHEIAAAAAEFQPLPEPIPEYVAPSWGPQLGEKVGGKAHGEKHK
jgi:mono/diheme cytochrome c family protein